jgi:hypothetical protein
MSITGLHTAKAPVSTKETMARVTIMARVSKDIIISPHITTSRINTMADPPTTVAAEDTEAAEDTIAEGVAEGAIAEAVIATSANITKTNTLPETQVDTVDTEFDLAALLRVRRSPLPEEVPFSDRGSAGGMGQQLVSIH